MTPQRCALYFDISGYNINETINLILTASLQSVFLISISWNRWQIIKQTTKRMAQLGKQSELIIRHSQFTSLWNFKFQFSDEVPGISRNSRKIGKLLEIPSKFVSGCRAELGNGKPVSKSKWCDVRRTVKFEKHQEACRMKECGKFSDTEN